MINFSLISIRQFTDPVKSFTQVVFRPWIILYADGCIYERVFDNKGKLLFELHNDLNPALFLFLPGMKLEFSYSAKRNNWAIILSDLQLRYSGQPDMFEIYDGQFWIPIPRMVPLSNEMLNYWELEFSRIKDVHQSSLPADQFYCKLAVCDIIKYIISRRDDLSSSLSPAEKLKKLLDADSKFEKSIEQLCKECSYSSDYLRELFKKQYGLAPQNYRFQKRMHEAMRLITDSSLLVKEISDILGFDYNSHFTKVFRKEYNISPRDAIRKFRNV
ncbi:MAG: AraC family transcriptional regulator [Victivallaceae bacterium]|nr:AraC family transcriptional regulator [Victivallaceae bacterium]